MTKDTVTVRGDRIIDVAVTIDDRSLARYVSELPDEQRLSVCRSGIANALLAARRLDVGLDTQFVTDAIDGSLAGWTEQQNVAVDRFEAIVKETFADGDGRLPKEIRRFLKELPVILSRPFDPSDPGSGVSILTRELSQLISGRSSAFGIMLDPARADSPLYEPWRELMEAVRGLERELAAGRARAQERMGGPQKGGDMEDVLEQVLNALAAGMSDTVQRTGNVIGSIARCKKGDFLIDVDSAYTRGRELRVVVESKAGGKSQPEIVRELEIAKRNRGAAIAVAVFRPGAAPLGISGLRRVGGDLVCTFDPDDGDATALAASIEMARILGTIGIDQEGEPGPDSGAILQEVERIEAQISTISAVRSSLTSIASATSSQLDDAKMKLERLQGGARTSLVNLRRLCDPPAQADAA